MGDITSSVLLARELHDSQENANAQLDMMLGMMHVDPLQLISFLDTAETGLKLVNTILKEPARTDAEFRKKLTGLFRELHSIKGEASALNLKSIASRVHALEDMVSDCKKRPELSGNDFLPLVLKLDDLLAHLRSVREMAARLTTLKDTPAASEHSTATTGTMPLARLPLPSGRPNGRSRARSRTCPRRCSRWPSASPRTTPSASGSRSRASARCRRRTAPRSRTASSRCCATRRCTASSPRRCAAGSPRTTSGWCAWTSARPARATNSSSRTTAPVSRRTALRAAAVRKQLITEEEASIMDTRSTMALIFRPGFSTQEDVSMDAGRGVGMDVVARSVYALGGKIGVSTHPGKFTRFKIVLPATDAAGSTAVA